MEILAISFLERVKIYLLDGIMTGVNRSVYDYMLDEGRMAAIQLISSKIRELEKFTTASRVD